MIQNEILKVCRLYVIVRKRNEEKGILLREVYRKKIVSQNK